MKIKVPALNLLRHLNPLKLVKNWWKIKGFKKWLLLAVFLFVVSFVFNNISSMVNKGKPDLGKFQIVKVGKQDMKKVITKEGVLRFAGVVNYPAPVSGIVTKLYVNDGELVKKGQEILSLQSTATKQEQAEAWSQYLTAKSSLDAAKTAKITSQANLESARQTVLEASQDRKNMEERFSVGDRQNATASRPEKNYTENEVEAIKSSETQARSKFVVAEKEYNSADAKIEAAQAALNTSLWKYQLTKDAVVTAPIDGQLTNLNVSTGETVSSENGILFRLISSDKLLITLKASEAEIIHFRVGQTTEFKTPIYPDEIFKGNVITVDSIGTEVKNDNGSVMEYVVKIQAEAVNKKLLSPMTVDTDTVVEKKAAVLSVPNSAVTYGAGKRTVTVVKNGRTETRKVVLGIIGTDYTEIISGLKEGESILIPRIKKI